MYNPKISSPGRLHATDSAGMRRQPVDACVSIDPRHGAALKVKASNRETTHTLHVPEAQDMRSPLRTEAQSLDFNMSELLRTAGGSRLGPHGCIDVASHAKSSGRGKRGPWTCKCAREMWRKGRNNNRCFRLFLLV